MDSSGLDLAAELHPRDARRLRAGIGIIELAPQLPSTRRSVRDVLCAYQFFTPDLSYARGFFRGGGMKSIGQAQRTEAEIATSTLFRIAFEYGQMA
jgi:hypothetical protein